ncbi:S8 family serine peptidase [Nocardioides pacificus]
MLPRRHWPLALLRPALPAAMALLLGLGAAGVPLSAEARPTFDRPTVDDASASGSLSHALYLVTLDGPGTAGYRGSLTSADYRTRQLAEQDDTLAAVGADEPIYRWTTALSGVAVHLTPGQASALATTPGVASVEPNAVRRLAGTRDGARAPGSPRSSGGGEGVVVGIVDSGIWPESPLFTGHTGGPTNGRFRGTCVPAEDWPTDGCDAKLVGASWFVAGFGADAVRASSSLSALDDSGHGTQVASIAVGNAGVSVDAAGESMGTYSGVAPAAALAVYKACWTAPDPADDGCATADLVTAIDRATEDRVDVLNLSVAGGSARDTVARALLGATEAGIVVSTAAGRAQSAQPPWVVSVGATTSAVRQGAVRVVGGPRLTGAMLSRRTTEPAPLVLAADAVAPGSRRADARLCRPGSLDAGKVSGAVVLCARGGIGRVDKSLAVQRADGVAMVLVNPSGGDVAADFHSVPTVHLSASDGRRLQRRLARHDDTQVVLTPLGDAGGRLRMAPFSPTGEGSGAADLVAPGVGVLGAVPPDDSGPRWDFLTGTSAAAAHVSGTAADLLARGLTPAQVRSALVTSARPLGDAPVTQQGSGALQSLEARRPGLTLTTRTAGYRAWLEAGLPRGKEGRALNLPEITIDPGQRQTTRRVTNTGSRALYFSSAARGFERYGVLVTPAALRLGPGESATFRVRLDRPAVAGRRDDGYVVWRGANGTRVGVPVLVAP